MAYPQGTGSLALVLTQGSGVTGMIVDPRFCVSYPVEIVIVRKVMRLTAGNFVVKDVNGKILFKVKDRVLGLHDKRSLLDSSGSPVLTLQEKIMTMHSRWEVFRGGSTEPGDLLYTVKKSSLIQFRTKLKVFLSHNKEEQKCDFLVKGNWSDSSCTVYAGESNTIVAKMDKEDSFWGKDKFSVTVNPNVDFAFIASLIVILDDVDRPTSLPILDIGLTMLS